MKDIHQFGFLKVFFHTADLSKNIWRCWSLFLIYGVLMTLLALVCGRINYGCLQNQEDFWCKYLLSVPNIALISLIGYLILSLVFVAFFCYDYYQKAFKNKGADWYHVLNFSKEKISGAIVFLGYIFCLVFPIICEFQILLRKANPDWRIEMIFFLALFGFVVLNFFTIQVFSCISRFFRNGNKVDISLIVKQTTGKSSVIILLFLVFFGILNLLILNINGFLQHFSAEYKHFYPVLVAEFIGNVVVLFCVAIMVTLSRSIDDFLLNEEIEEQEEKVETSNIKRGKKKKEAIMSRKKDKNKKRF